MGKEGANNGMSSSENNNDDGSNAGKEISMVVPSLPGDTHDFLNVPREMSPSLPPSCLSANWCGS